MLKMENVSYREFENICRICLSRSNLTHLQELEYIVGLFSKITDIQVESLDELPQNICKECVQKLESISNFISLSKQNDSLLRQIVLNRTQIKLETDEVDIIEEENNRDSYIKMEPESESNSVVESDESEYKADMNDEQELTEEISNLYDGHPEVNLSKQQHVGKTSNIEQAREKSLRKRTICLFCNLDVLNFSRHVLRHHRKEDIVKELQKLPPLDPKRKAIFESIRKQGNFSLHNKGNMRPSRKSNLHNGNEEYLSCDFCLGFYSRHFIRQHRTKCKFRRNDEINNTKRQNHWAKCQIHTLCFGPFKEFYNSVKITKEVFPKMRNDEVTRVAIHDLLICSYGENQMSRTKVPQRLINGMRELSRLLIALRKTTGVHKLVDNLKPQYYNNFIEATKTISGHNAETRTYQSINFVLRLESRLKKVCRIAEKSILNGYDYFSGRNSKDTLEDIEQIKALIENYWYMDLHILEFDHLNKDEKKKNSNPKLLTIVNDIKIFYNYVMTESNKAIKNIEQNIDICASYKSLCECVLSFSILFNKKRVNEVEYILLSTYKEEVLISEEKFLRLLTASEKMQLKCFKKVVSYGKCCKPVTVLFPKNIQSFIKILLKARSTCVPMGNQFLFAHPEGNAWLAGDDVIKKIVCEAGVENIDLFTLPGLCNEISTVLRVLNMTEEEINEFETLTEISGIVNDKCRKIKLHCVTLWCLEVNISKVLSSLATSTIPVLRDAEFWRRNTEFGEVKSKFPEAQAITVCGSHVVEQLQILTSIKDDTYLTAKMSKILMVIDKGHAEEFKRKNLQEIEFSDLEPDDSKQYTNSKLESTIIHFEENKITAQIPAKSRNLKKKWTVEQKRLLKTYFADFIKNKEAPKKRTVEDFISQYIDVFYDRNWTSIKAFVYNCYRNKIISIGQPLVKRKKWTPEQQRLIKDYFKESIIRKEAPKKGVVEDFITKYNNMFKGRNWIVIKAFVYNCYRDKQ